MSIRNHVAVSAAVFICVTCAARADHRPVIAVPGNAQVPVIIDGVEANFAVVVGDWGLHAPGRIAPEIYYSPIVIPEHADRGYFPATGRRPRYGRDEINAPRQVLPPAPSFRREWSTSSGTSQVTQYPPFYAPEVSLGVEPRAGENACSDEECRRSERRAKRLRRPRGARF